MYVVVTEPEVYHFGILPGGLVARPGVWTYEGDALSVSLCPEDWWKAPGVAMSGAELYAIYRAELAWAKSRAVDGVWFSDPITATAPLSSRGGVFQDRLKDFRYRTVGACDAVSWPATPLRGLN